MNGPGFKVRRATLEDLNALKALWESMRLPAPDLEKRLTEFQVVENTEGKIAGALGFQILGRQGRLHSEAFADFSVADQVRPLVWQRLQSLAMNHGVFRVWTHEQAPFWTRNGFQSSSAETLQKLPEAWDRSVPGWLTLQLKDEEVIASVDKEFAMFMESEKQRSARALDQARTLKKVITVLACIVALAILALAAWLYFVRKRPGALGP
jgi:N-acetylglutamate synthase-like GNAT family acetyltransferase